MQSHGTWSHGSIPLLGSYFPGHILDLNIDLDVDPLSQIVSPPSDASSIHDGLDQGLDVLRERVQGLVIPEVQRTFHLPVLGDFRSVPGKGADSDLPTARSGGFQVAKRVEGGLEASDRGLWASGNSP